MPTPSFVSDLFSSVQNEDVDSERAIVRLLGRSQQRVLMIASAGENVLGLLCQPEVGFVDAVDLSLAQVELCALRAAAAGQLSRDEQLALFGSDPARAGQAGGHHDGREIDPRQRRHRQQPVSRQADHDERQH